MSIGLVGSRGIPARYGGTETFVEELSRELIRNGFRVYVTCESKKFGEDTYNGVIRVHVPSIQGKSLTIPSINDVLATMYLLRTHSSDIKVMYFVSPDGSLAAITGRMSKKKILINPDGIEWKRLIKRARFVPFYSIPLYMLTMAYLYLMEWLSCKLPDVTVADSIAIKHHLERTHGVKNIVYIPYGARELPDFNTSDEFVRGILKKYGLTANEYYLTVARIVAENNIHTEIEGFKRSNSSKKLVIVGNFDKKSGYTKHLYKLKGNDDRILFLNPIYDQGILGILRRNSFAYIHAYEVGGTNPSLIEQMRFGRPILAYDVPFNREVLGKGGIYFKNPQDLAEKMTLLEGGSLNLKQIKKAQIKKVQRQYSWKKVTREYIHLFKRLMEGLQ